MVEDQIGLLFHRRNVLHLQFGFHGKDFADALGTGLSLGIHHEQSGYSQQRIQDNGEVAHEGNDFSRLGHAHGHPHSTHQHHRRKSYVQQ